MKSTLAPVSLNELLTDADETKLKIYSLELTRPAHEAFNILAADDPGFKDALLDATDYLGRLLAVAWGNLSPDFLTYHEILRSLLRADRDVSSGQHQETIRECFAWREISLFRGRCCFAHTP
jgi:hypothetical protein